MQLLVQADDDSEVASMSLHVTDDALSAWPPKRARWLKMEATQTFRKFYRDYREGHWKGAKGELSTIAAGGALTKHHTLASAPEASRGQSPRGEIDSIQASSIFEDVEDPEVIRYLQGLEQYRRAYRRFRLGGTKGAEGEVSKYAEHFTSDQLRLLPVAALARCLADQVRQKVAVEPPTAKFHVHLGAGKLGLGLVVPAIVCTGTPFAILQRPSDVWQPILKSTHATVRVCVNDDVVATLSVVRCFNDLCKLGYVGTASSAASASASACSPVPCTAVDDVERLTLPPSDPSSSSSSRGLLVLDPSLDPLILRSADALSCSLGPAIKTSLSKLASFLPPHSGLYRPALYACENDHQAVDSVRGLLEKSLYLKECMVDRICSERLITEDQIAVTTEPDAGEIVVTARFPESIKPAFGGPNVLLPSTGGAYSYLYNRKFLLVNGTHTTLAFMTLRKLCKDPCEAPGDYQLLDPKTFSGELKQELLAWAAARCLVLLHNHEVTVLKFAHNVERDDRVVHHLWDYATRTIKRFSTVKDSTKRVLGGGVANRYETRLKAILDTLETFDKSVPLGTQMLRAAGFTSMVQLKSILRRLVRDAECFVTSPEECEQRREESANNNRSGGGSRIVEEYHQQFKSM